MQSVFLRCDNRLNRKRYILRCLTVSVVVSAGMVGLALIADRLSGSEITAAAVLLWLIAFIPGLLLTIRRLHDLDKPSWWCIGMFIPIVNFLLLFFLLFYRGTKGPNRYGPDPLDMGFAFRGFVSLLVDNRQLRTDFFVNHVAVFVVHVTDLAEE